MCVNLSPGCLLWDIRQLPNYSAWHVFWRHGVFFFFVVKPPAVLSLGDAKRERSPPAELRDVIVSELLNKIFRCFESPQKLKHSIHTSSFLNRGVNYASFQVLWGF